MLLFSIFAQVINAVQYTTFRRDVDVLLSKRDAVWSGDYGKRAVNFEAPVEINNSTLTITLGGESFEFMEIPREWNVGRSFRTVRYEAIDNNTLGKVYIYLIEYDKTDNCRLMLVWYDLDDKPTEIYNIRK